MWMPGGAVCSARSTSSATLDARTGCSLVGSMYLKIDSIQSAVLARKLAVGSPAPGLRAERTSSSRSNPSVASACSSRLASPRLSASGRRPWSCGCTTASVVTPERRIHAATRTSCAGSGAHSARSRSWYRRGGSNRISPVPAASSGQASMAWSSTCAALTPRRPSVIGSRASTRMAPTPGAPTSRRSTSCPSAPVAPAITTPVGAPADALDVPAGAIGRLAACRA